MRPKTTNSDLPQGVIRRKRGNWTGYYFNVTVDGKRREIPLGRSREEALSNWKQIAPKYIAADKQPTNWEAALRSVLKSTKARAKHRKFAFELTMDHVLAMFAKNEGRCELSGIAFSAKSMNGKRFRPWMPSIDRRDSSKGYTLDNSRMICAYVNVAINQFGESTLLYVAREISRTLAAVENRRVAEIAEIPAT